VTNRSAWPKSLLDKQKGISGMRTFGDEQFKAQIETDTGIRPAWNPEAFADSAADVRQSINRVKASPFLPHTDQVRGFVYDDKTGALTEI